MRNYDRADKTQFGIQNDLSHFATLILACRLNSYYLYGENRVELSGEGSQLDKYSAYAKEHNISNPCTSSNQGTPIIRLTFADTLASAVPDSALQEINIIQENAIPDVDKDTPFCESIYKLYRAGVITGNDLQGTFNPYATITREAACAIVTRIIDPTLRKSISLHIDKGPVQEAISIVTDDLPQNTRGASRYSMYVGECAQFYAIGENSGNIVPVTWTVSDTTIATISTDGTLTALSSGDLYITAVTAAGNIAQIYQYVSSREKENVVLAAYAYDTLQRTLKFPASLTIYGIYAGYGTMFSSGRNVAMIDYSAMNSFGGYQRCYLMVWFDDDGFRQWSYDNYYCPSDLINCQMLSEADVLAQYFEWQ